MKQVTATRSCVNADTQSRPLSVRCSTTRKAHVDRRFVFTRSEGQTDILVSEVRPETPLPPLTLGNPVAISDNGSNRQEDRHAGH
jgi:hypothetical protein